MGLQVLAEYAALVYAGDQDIQVTVVASPPCEVSELSISNENKFVLQEQTIQVLPTFVQIAAVGTGCAIGKVIPSTPIVIGIGEDRYQIQCPEVFQILIYMSNNRIIQFCAED